MQTAYDIKKIEYFGKRLELFIKLNFDSAAEYARFIGVDRSQVTSYIKGRTIPPTKSLPKLLSSGVNIVWLLTGEGAMYASNDVGRDLYKKNKNKYISVAHDDDEAISEYLKDNSMFYEPEEETSNDSDTEKSDITKDELKDFFKELGDKISDLPDMVNKLINK